MPTSMMGHNFRVYKTTELAIMECFYHNHHKLFQTKSLLSYLQDIAKNVRIFNTLSTGNRDNQCTNSINQSIMEYSCMRANALKERIEDPFIVPKQGTKHLVTDALVLPCQLLVLPATI